MDLRGTARNFFRGLSGEDPIQETPAPNFSITDLPVYPVGSKEYKADLKSRNGGATPGVNDKEIEAMVAQISSGAIPPEHVEILAHRNPSAAPILKNAEVMKGMRIGAAQASQNVAPVNGMSGPPDYTQGAAYAAREGQTGLAGDYMGLAKAQQASSTVTDANGNTFATFVGKDGNLYYIDKSGNAQRARGDIPEGNFNPYAPVVQDIPGKGQVIINRGTTDQATPVPVSGAGESVITGGLAGREAAKTAASEGEKLKIDYKKSKPIDLSLIRQTTSNMNLTDRMLERAKKQVNYWTTGLMSDTKIAKGTPARNLQETLNAISGRLFIDILQNMRENSKTGGAVGSVAVQEMETLKSTWGSLSQSQDPEQLLENLNMIQQMLHDTRGNMISKYQDTYQEKIPSYLEKKAEEPKGVDPALLKYMTPEERKLFQ